MKTAGGLNTLTLRSDSFTPLGHHKNIALVMNPLCEGKRMEHEKPVGVYIGMFFMKSNVKFRAWRDCAIKF